MAKIGTMLMHSAWDMGKVFLAPTPQEALIKALHYHRKCVLEYKPDDFDDDEWVESSWEQGEWTLQDIEVIDD